MTSRYGVTIQDEASIQVEILERMFDDPDLANLRSRHPRHPAVENHTRLKAIATSMPSTSSGNTAQTALAIATTLLDRSTWASQNADTDYWAFLTDGHARRQIRQRIRNPHQYGDAIAELFYWGWLQTEGLPTVLVDEEGKPDLRLQLPTGNTLAEVKRIRPSTQPTRIPRIISKANDQIKRADPGGSGVLFISIARSAWSTGTDSEIPVDIRPYLDQVERRMASGLLRSVARVVVTWDDWIEHETDHDATAYTIRRQSTVRDHLDPRTSVSPDLGSLDIGMTVLVAAHRGPTT